MNEPEKPIELRDQLAMSIMENFMGFMTEHYMNSFKDYIQHGMTPSAKQHWAHNEEQFERLARLSYKLADKIRKIRLATFE